MSYYQIFKEDSAPNIVRKVICTEQRKGHCQTFKVYIIEFIMFKNNLNPDTVSVFFEKSALYETR
jgi:hypothetical protein